MTKVQTLMVSGPRNFNNRDLIVDHLIDCVCDWSITRVITGDQFGVDQIVSELINSYTDVEYERIYPDFNKFGKIAKIRSIWQMTSQSTYLLLFDNRLDSVYDVMYFAKRYDLIIRIVNV